MPKNDEEKRELYTKLGMPEDPSKYETSVPADMQQYFDENTMQSFKQVAHDIGLNNEQVNKLIEYQAGQISQQTEMQQAGLSEQKEVVERDLKNEYGHTMRRFLFHAFVFTLIFVHRIASPIQVRRTTILT